MTGTSTRTTGWGPSTRSTSALLAASVWVAVGWATVGCRNSCQDLCAEMADYAEECSLPVTDADLDACIDRNTDPTPEDSDTCREFGDPDVMRATWACEDLQRYWVADG